MNSQQIKDFLASNPTQEEKQAAWDQHLKDVGYVRGMPLMCCCGCNKFSWGSLPEGVEKWYLPGHEPKAGPVEYKTQSAPKVKGEDDWWVVAASNMILLVLLALSMYFIWSLPKILTFVFS